MFLGRDGVGINDHESIDAAFVAMICWVIFVDARFWVRSVGCGTASGGREGGREGKWCIQVLLFYF